MDAMRQGAKGLADEIAREALRDFEAGLKQIYADASPGIVVYGSYARNEATEESDLDLLLLYSRPVNASQEIMRIVPLLADINLRYGMLLSVLPVSTAAFRDAQGPFWRNVRREGVPVNGS